MKHYAGLDVSVKETSVCIVDEAGDICREVKVASHPEDLAQLLKDPAWRFACQFASKRDPLFASNRLRELQR